MMSAEDLKKVRSKCGWAGCRNSFLLSSGAPKGWRSLLLFRDNEQSLNGGGLLDVMSLSELQRDTALCPHHVKELDALLTPLHMAIANAPVAGNA